MRGNCCHPGSSLKNFRLVSTAILRYTTISKMLWGDAMSAAEIEKSIRTATRFLEMEGLHIDEQCVAWCRQMLSGEISSEEYLQLVTAREGV